MGRRGILVLALVAALLVPLGGASAETECAAGYAETFEVTAKARRNAYRIGQTAVVDVVVTDSVTGTPQGDVDAGIIIKGRGKKWPFDFRKTDGEGRAVMRLRLRRSMVKPGWAKAFVGAWDSIETAAYCTGRYGQREYPRLFRIRG